MRRLLLSAGITLACLSNGCGFDSTSPREEVERQARISGKVRTASGAPVAGVAVTHWIGQTDTVFSDTTGYFQTPWVSITNKKKGLGECQVGWDFRKGTHGTRAFVACMDVFRTIDDWPEEG